MANWEFKKSRESAKSMHNGPQNDDIWKSMRQSNGVLRMDLFQMIWKSADLRKSQSPRNPDY